MATPRLYEDSRIFLFAGHYGSGKSEVAVNFTLSLAACHRAAIVDFDIINPYFRTASARAALESKGVRVVAPIYANTNIDVPALPAEISALFDDKQVKAVFDVGGDSAGARAVSRYRDDFLSERTECFFVFNLRRPETSTVCKAAEIFYAIQKSARLPFTAIVNNTNLLSDTSERDLSEGLDAALELSDRLSLPVAFSAAMEGAAAGAPAFCARSARLGIPIFCIGKYISMEYQ